GGQGGGSKLEEGVDLLQGEGGGFEDQARRLLHAQPKQKVQDQGDDGREHQRGADQRRQRTRRRSGNGRKDFDRQSGDDRKSQDQRPPRVEQPRINDLNAVDDDEG